MHQDNMRLVHAACYSFMLIFQVPPLGEKQSPWTTFKLGLFMGAFCVLGIVLVVSAVFVNGHDNWRIPVRLYRGPLMIIITIFLLGINIYGWRSSGKVSGSVWDLIL